MSGGYAACGLPTLMPSNCFNEAAAHERRIRSTRRRRGRRPGLYCFNEAAAHERRIRSSRHRLITWCFCFNEAAAHERRILL